MEAIKRGVPCDRNFRSPFQQKFWLHGLCFIWSLLKITKNNVDCWLVMLRVSCVLPLRWFDTWERENNKRQAAQTEINTKYWAVTWGSDQKYWKSKCNGSVAHLKKATSLFQTLVSLNYQVPVSGQYLWLQMEFEWLPSVLKQELDPCQLKWGS